MRKALLGWLLICACAHERASAAAALGCSEEKVQLVAEAPLRPYQRPRATAAAQAAMSGVGAAVGALASMVGSGSGSAAYYLPAGSIQLAAPGWRHYEGCARALVCFDGGFCVRGDDLQTSRAVPALMSRSQAELGGQLEPETECREPKAYADRRGLGVWTLSRCGASFACKVAEGGYTCSDDKGRSVTKER